MNDHNLSFYILPTDENSSWNFLFEAHDAISLHRAISKRPIHESAFLTVYVDSYNWLILGTQRGPHFDRLTIKSHLISSKQAKTIWRLAKVTRDNHINFKDDMTAIRDRFFPSGINRAFGCNL